jgi:hypothetical protein
MDQQDHPGQEAAVERAKASLNQYLAEQRDLRQAQTATLAAIEEKQLKLLLGHLSPDELKALAGERRRVLEASAARNIQHRRQGVAPLAAPRADTAGGAVFVGPPYDFGWQTSNPDAAATVDLGNGTYSLAIQGFGDGNQSIAAGFGIWFFSGDGDPAQRFAALWDYYDDWWDMAAGYVAHNDGRTYLGVFGESENAWVAQSSSQTPTWSDGAGWFDTHGNDPSGDDGRVSAETYFNARPNSWYQCWVWSSASIYSTSGFFGFSASSIHLNMTVPFFVLGSVAL